MAERIPVPKSDLVAPEAWRPCLRVGYFIERVKEHGGEVKLPPGALHFADLWEYLGEITNGGHAQYFENEEDCISQLQTMRELLRSIGLPNHAELLNEFEHVVSENENRLFDLYVSGDAMTAKEFFYGIDDRFAELERGEGKLQDRLRDWLVQQPWIVEEED